MSGVGFRGSLGSPCGCAEGQDRRTHPGEGLHCVRATTGEPPSAVRRRDLPRFAILCLCITSLNRKGA